MVLVAGPQALGPTSKINVKSGLSLAGITPLESMSDYDHLRHWANINHGDFDPNKVPSVSSEHSVRKLGAAIYEQIPLDYQGNSHDFPRLAFCRYEKQAANMYLWVYMNIYLPMSLVGPPSTQIENVTLDRVEPLLARVKASIGNLYENKCLTDGRPVEAPEILVAGLRSSLHLFAGRPMAVVRSWRNQC